MRLLSKYEKLMEALPAGAGVGSPPGGRVGAVGLVSPPPSEGVESQFEALDETYSFCSAGTPKLAGANMPFVSNICGLLLTSAGFRSSSRPSRLNDCPLSL